MTRPDDYDLGEGDYRAELYELRARLEYLEAAVGVRRDGWQHPTPPADTALAEHYGECQHGLDLFNGCDLCGTRRP